MTRVHYHAGANIPGYMPEGDVFIFTNRRDAERCVADMAREYRVDQWDLPPSEARTGRGSARDGRIHFERWNDPYDLGLSFWWDRCQDSSCEADLQDLEA